MSRYRIEIHPAAMRSLRKLDPQIQPRIQGAIALLAEEPRPPNAKKLGGRDAYRVRVGNYRIIYQIQDQILLITVVTLGHRRNIYDR